MNFDTHHYTTELDPFFMLSAGSYPVPQRIFCRFTGSASTDNFDFCKVVHRNLIQPYPEPVIIKGDDDCTPRDSSPRQEVASSDATPCATVAYWSSGTNSTGRFSALRGLVGRHEVVLPKPCGISWLAAIPLSSKYVATEFARRSDSF